MIAENDDNDVLLLKRAFKKLAIEHKVYFVKDGEELIGWLNGIDSFGDRKFPLPTMLMIDLKMPKKSGLDVLGWLKNHPECSVIPTIVFTASAQNEDVKNVYRLAANTYFTKPNSFDELMRLLDLIFSYWFAAQVPDLSKGSKCVNS